MVIEPPCAALLNLCNSGGILEASKDSTDGLIVVGIQAVQNGSGQLIRSNQSVQEICHLSGGSVVVDTVISGIGTKLLKHQSIVVTLAAIM